MLRAYRSLEDAAADFGPCALTIGNFDGVHLGHQLILERTVRRARAAGWKAAALTFDPHPTRIVAPQRSPALMTTIEQRLERFTEHGLDEALVMAFTPEVAALSPETFARDVLAATLKARVVVVGSNFRFGHKHAGDVDTLRELGARYGFDCEAVPPVRLGGDVVSSSRVRAVLGEGRLREARLMLGRPFAVRGDVAPGRGIGARQTVPTLNMACESELTPADGVYVSETRDLGDGRRWRSITNVGVRPTFGAGERTVETHLLEAIEGDAPRRIEICFLRRLREERTFPSAEELKKQILSDIAEAQRFFRLRAAMA